MTDSPGTVKVWKTQGRVESRGLRNAPGRLNSRPEAVALPAHLAARLRSEDRESRDLKEETSHAIPGPPGCRSSPRLGRGPIILKLESLERRALMAANSNSNSTLPDLANSALTVSSNVSDWNQSVEVEGKVTNQGHSATTATLQVGLYASPVRGIDKFSVPVGEVTIPAGLAPGQTVPYETSIQLPATAIPDVSSNGGTLYIAAWVNPGRIIAESNYRNDRDLGPPYDSAPISIQRRNLPIWSGRPWRSPRPIPPGAARSR